MAPSNLVRTTVRTMSGYAPGEQPAPGERVVKLNTNENPYPPSPRVMEAIQAVDVEMLRRYPHPLADRFRESCARLWSVEANQIIAGNGSDDILTIATRTFVPPGGSIASPDPSYSLYPVLARLEDARHVGVPWLDGFGLPIEALIATRASAIYLANPNAPTGTVVEIAEIAKLARAFAGLVLVDEAYGDFWGQSAVPLVKDFANVVVSRSLSKGYALAGLRFGYGVAQSGVIDEMMKVKDSYNCDAISIVAATAAIEDQAHASRGWENVRLERERMTHHLSELGFKVIPSQANFVLATVPGGDGRRFYEGLRRQGILVRYFDKPGLSDKLRITVGTGQENDALIAGLLTMIEKQQAA